MKKKCNRYAAVASKPSRYANSYPTYGIFPPAVFQVPVSTTG